VKVLLIVVDGASPRVLCPAVRSGRLSNLARLANAGEMHEASVSIFPSITPAATASIVTGAYPAQHGIAGAAWFDEAAGEVAYYGDDFWVIAQKGFATFLRDFLVGLNGPRLTEATLMERCEAAGLTAGSVNYLVYRGPVHHRVNVPWLMALLPGVPLTETIAGPSTLRLGDFVDSQAPAHHLWPRPGGVFHRFGMDDAATGSFLTDMASRDTWPDFVVAYFADNDFRSHEVGPVAALPVIERVDAMLGKVFDAAGGFDRFMHDRCVILTSDHGHCDIGPERDQAVIDLRSTFDGFVQAQLGRPWQPNDDILICPNMRAAQLYVRDPAALTDRVIAAARKDPRIDLVMWRTAVSGGDEQGYSIAGPRGRLSFWRAGNSGRGTYGVSGSSRTARAAINGRGRDAQGTEWEWRGDLEVLSLDSSDGVLQSLEYPNAFERIAGGLDARNSGEVWLTAVPGCEFDVQGGRAHPGGSSHGALHALDSLSPVIVAGLPRALPRAMRLVDIAALCTEALGLPLVRSVGEAYHGAPTPSVLHR
jgi:hypothetical protein